MVPQGWAEGRMCHGWNLALDLSWREHRRGPVPRHQGNSIVIFYQHQPINQLWIACEQWQLMESGSHGGLLVPALCAERLEGVSQRRQPQIFPRYCRRLVRRTSIPHHGRLLRGVQPERQIARSIKGWPTTNLIFSGGIRPAFCRESGSRQC